jgi:hypothetical protein
MASSAQNTQTVACDTTNPSLYIIPIVTCQTVNTPLYWVHTVTGETVSPLWYFLCMYLTTFIHFYHLSFGSLKVNVWVAHFSCFVTDIQFGNAKFSCLSATAGFLYIFNDHCQSFKVQVITASHASWYLWQCRMSLTNRVTLYSPADSVSFLDLATD